MGRGAMGIVSRPFDYNVIHVYDHCYLYPACCPRFVEHAVVVLIVLEAQFRQLHRDIIAQQFGGLDGSLKRLVQFDHAGSILSNKLSELVQDHGDDYSCWLYA